MRAGAGRLAHARRPSSRRCASLAGYAFEHPADPFPEIVEDGPRFEAEGLGHPLLAGGALRAQRRASRARAACSSSAARTCRARARCCAASGVNAVLAWPARRCARARLRISPLAVGASIRIQDSLQEGTSRFYAEITRLRRLVDLAAGGRPLLFLLDEILHGTNSARPAHRRRGGGARLVSAAPSAWSPPTTWRWRTSPTSWRRAPPTCTSRTTSRTADGFDYRMRPGVVQTANALRLMRTLGALARRRRPDGQPSEGDLGQCRSKSRSS